MHRNVSLKLIEDLMVDKLPSDLLVKVLQGLKDNSLRQIINCRNSDNSWRFLLLWAKGDWGYTNIDLISYNSAAISAGQFLAMKTSHIWNKFALRTNKRRAILCSEVSTKEFPDFCISRLSKTHDVTLDDAWDEYFYNCEFSGHAGKAAYPFTYDRYRSWIADIAIKPRSYNIHQAIISILPDNFLEFHLEDYAGRFDTEPHRACNGPFFNFHNGTIPPAKDELIEAGYLFAEDRYLMSAAIGRAVNPLELRKHIDTYRLLFKLVDEVLKS